MQKTFEKIEENLKDLDESIRSLSCELNENIVCQFNPLEGFCKSNKSDTNTLEGIFIDLWSRYHYTWFMQDAVENEISAKFISEAKIASLSKLLIKIEGINPEIFKVIDQLRKDAIVSRRFNDYLKMLLYARECNKIPVRKYKEELELSLAARKDLYDAELDFELGAFCNNFKFSSNLMKHMSSNILERLALRKYNKCIIAYQEHEGGLAYILARLENGKHAFKIVNIKEKEREMLDLKNVSKIIEYTRAHNMRALNEAVLQLQ